MSEHLTMQELNELGFQLTKSYPYNDFVIQRREKGLITIETTWQMPFGNCVGQEIIIRQYEPMKFTYDELKSLDLILNKNNHETEI